MSFSRIDAVIVGMVIKADIPASAIRQFRADMLAVGGKRITDAVTDATASIIGGSAAS